MRPRQPDVAAGKLHEVQRQVRVVVKTFIKEAVQALRRRRAEFEEDLQVEALDVAVAEAVVELLRPGDPARPDGVRPARAADLLGDAVGADDARGDLLLVAAPGGVPPGVLVADGQ